MAKCDEGGNIFASASRLFLCCFIVVDVGPICHAAPPELKVMNVTSNFGHIDCPVWYNGDSSVYFIDQTKQQLIRYAQQTGEVKPIDAPSKSFKFMVPVDGDKPRFVGGDGLKITLFSWDGAAGFLTDENHMSVITNTDEGFLCGAADIQQRLWIGTSFSATEGRLYMVDIYGAVTVKLDNIGIPRAIAFSPSQPGVNQLRMYLADSTKNVIIAYPFDIKTGEIPTMGSILIFDFAVQNVSCSVVAMAVDVDGNLWIACDGKNSVIQIDAVNAGQSSSVLTTVTLPENQNVTNVIFGGQHMDGLYVTSTQQLFHVTGTGKNGATELKLKVEWPQE